MPKAIDSHYEMKSRQSVQNRSTDSHEMFELQFKHLLLLSTPWRYFAPLLLIYVVFNEILYSDGQTPRFVYKINLHRKRISVGYNPLSANNTKDTYTMV